MEQAVNWMIDMLGLLGPLGIAGLATVLMTMLLFLRDSEARASGSRPHDSLLPRRPARPETF